MDIDNIVSSIFVAVVTSILTVYFAFRKYKSEKWWDAKSKCYLDTIEALNNMMQYCDAVLQNDQDTDEEPEAAIQVLKKRFSQGKFEFEKQSNIGSLLLSDGAQKNLLTLDHAIYAAESEEALQLQMAKIRVAIEECLADFIPNAQNDLK